MNKREIKKENNINIKKGARCDMTKNELYEKYNNFYNDNSNDINKMLERREKFTKMNEKYGNRYIKIKEKFNENKEN